MIISMDEILLQEIEAGLHCKDNLAFRVKWVGILRSIVSRRCDKNKVGTPLCSDIDLILSSVEERREALVTLLSSKRES